GRCIRRILYLDLAEQGRTDKRLARALWCRCTNNQRHARWHRIRSERGRKRSSGGRYSESSDLQNREGSRSGSQRQVWILAYHDAVRIAPYIHILTGYKDCLA